MVWLFCSLCKRLKIKFMKTNIAILLLFFCLTSYSQNLTLDELIRLRKKDIAGVEEFLTAKNWSFLSSEEPKSDTLGSATFAYGKNDYDDKAQSFIIYYYSDNSWFKRIFIQVVSKEKYNFFLARIKSLGCKLIDSSISDGRIKKVYQGATTTFIINISSKKEEIFEVTKSSYHINIIENYDYELNYGVSEVTE